MTLATLGFIKVYIATATRRKKSDTSTSTMGTSASWTEGVCLRWMRQANSQAAAIREQEGFGKRKGADGGGAVAQKRPRPSAPFASPIAESPSTSTSTTTSTNVRDGSAGGHAGGGTAMHAAMQTAMCTTAMTAATITTASQVL